MSPMYLVYAMSLLYLLYLMHPMYISTVCTYVSMYVYGVPQCPQDLNQNRFDIPKSLRTSVFDFND